MRGWTHRATSADLVSLRLPAHDAGTGLAGPALGTCVAGVDFVFDPFDAYRAGLVTNPNIVVAGSIGAGKSTVVKMMITRALDARRRVVVIDPKGEYGALARANGVTPIRLGADGWCDPWPDERRRALDLVVAMVASAQGGALSASERYALARAWDETRASGQRRPLLALFAHLREDLDARTPGPRARLAAVLHRFVEGDLAGLFDGAGEPLRFEGSLVVLDVSRQWSSDAVGLCALAALAAAQQVLEDPARPGYLVLDEAWALLGDESALTWLRGSWKLARSRGISHLLVLHRWSDVAAGADAGTRAFERARGLLRECETQWLFRQPPDEADEMAAALGLHLHERRYLVALTKGVALVRYGAYRSVVAVRPDERDRTLIDTDAAMRDVS